jgi:plasmid stability protein
MPVNLSIKNVPDAVASRLRQRADRNHRSLQGELMAILESVVSDVEPARPTAATAARRISIDELVRCARERFPAGTPSSVDFIRASRDGRYGEKWVATGRHDEPE